MGISFVSYRHDFLAGSLFLHRNGIAHLQCKLLGLQSAVTANSA